MEPIDSKKTELEAICRKYQVTVLELFGSAAKGHFDQEASDLDFVVQFQETGTYVGSADRYFGLLESLEQLFDRHIDLVVKKAIKNPYFAEEVEESKVLVYAA